MHPVLQPVGLGLFLEHLVFLQLLHAGELTVLDDKAAVTIRIVPENVWWTGSMELIASSTFSMDCATSARTRVVSASSTSAIFHVALDRYRA